MGTINVAFLLKFGEKENLEKLLEEGEIYMNTIKYFKDFETKGIGDKYEGAVQIKNLKNGTLTLKIPNNPIVLNNKDVQIWKHHLNHIGNIYSTYAISTLLLKNKARHKIDKRMSEFGSYCLIIKDVKSFTDSILLKLDEFGFKYSHNLVKYKNYNIDQDLSLFNKTHLLSYQKEHRIIAYTTEEKPLKFNIGSIKHYAELYPSKDLIDSLVVDYH